MSRHVFREYDIRGVADRDLPDALVSRIGAGLGQMLAVPGRPARIAVARDCRLSGPRLLDALVRGLISTGVDVVDVGVGPTPMLYFAVHHLEADGGVMITGSHNPGDENGFKIMKGKASFFGEDLQRLATLAEQGTQLARPSGSFQEVEVAEAYVQKLCAGVSISGPRPRFVIDAGNGAAGPLAVRALRHAGLEPIALHCTMDGRFPNHHPDPTVPENLAELVARVRSEGALVGLAWDGDGDRLGVVDRDGKAIWGDRLLALYARDLLKDRPGAAVIAEVKCSQVLFDDIQRCGGRGILWKTGHSLIKTKMKEEHALLAGEMSGHFFFADRYFGFDDGIYAALRLMEILTREQRSVGELLADLPELASTPELRVPCPDELKAAVVAAVTERLAPLGELTAIDGCRVRFADGAWALVRASNTGPVIVMRIEAPTEARLAEVRALVDGVLAEARARVESATP